MLVYFTLVHLLIERKILCHKTWVFAYWALMGIDLSSRHYWFRWQWFRVTNDNTTTTNIPTTQRGKKFIIYTNGIEQLRIKSIIPEGCRFLRLRLTIFACLASICVDYKHLTVWVILTWTMNIQCRAVYDIKNSIPFWLHLVNNILY